MQLVVEKAAPRLVGLEPFAIYYKLWNCPLAHMADDLRGCGGICVHIYFGVLDVVRIKELLGRPAISAPGGGVNLNDHKTILLSSR